MLQFFGSQTVRKNWVTEQQLLQVFLPRSKYLLISWLQSLFTVILKPKKRKSVTHCFYFFPFHLPLSDGTVCHDVSFFNVEF